MKPRTYNQLKVGELYNTLRKRTYERTLFLEPVRKDSCGALKQDELFVILEILNITKGGFIEKWTKILTTGGEMGWTMFGWTMFIEV